MSDSEFSEGSYSDEVEEEELSSCEEESFDSDEIDIKLQKRSLNKLETKIAMTGKQKIVKQTQKVAVKTKETAQVKKRDAKQ